MLKIQNKTFSSIFIKSIKMVESLTKKCLCTTHGYRQQYGNWLEEGRGWGWVETGKRKKTGKL